MRKKLSEFVSNLLDEQMTDEQQSLILVPDCEEIGGDNSNCTNRDPAGCNTSNTKCTNFDANCSGDKISNNGCQNKSSGPATNLTFGC